MTGSALRLHARESIGSWFEQSLVARRQEHLAFRAETTLAVRTAQVFSRPPAWFTTTTGTSFTSWPSPGMSSWGGR
jgi:hypothetical protein